jgi:hypothetical protein
VYPFYRRLGGPQGQSGRVRKISPPPGLDPLTVQPVASRYTDLATLPILKVHDSLEYNHISDTVMDLAGPVQEWR